MAAVLLSPRNPLLKEIRRAVAQGQPTAGGYCVAESFHLLEEAIRSRCEIQSVVAAVSSLDRVKNAMSGRGIPLVSVADDLFAKIASTEQTQGVLALVRLPNWEPDDLFRPPALTVVLDGIQDPGNAGAIVRTAEAFGATGVIFLKGTASVCNPKTLRASAGSLFRVPLLSGLTAEDAQRLLAARGLNIFSSTPRGGKTPAGADLREPCALLIGSEGKGLAGSLLQAGQALRIPTAGVESLNAAMAAGILLYEARRQRQTTV